MEPVVIASYNEGRVGGNGAIPVMSGRRIEATTLDFSSLENLGEHLPLCEELAAVSSAFEWQAGAELVSQQSQGSDLFLILRGSVRVNMVATSGRQITYQILDRGEFFGELSAIDNGPRSASVFAETDCCVARLQQADLQRLLRDEPALSQVLLLRLVRLSRWLATRVYEYHAYDVKGRVYSELLREAKGDHTGPVVVQVSDQDMASRVGTTRENVTRIYGELRKQGLIDRSNKTLELLSPVALEALIKDCVFN